MDLNLIIFIIILYILGSTLFRKVTFYLFDIIWRFLIILGVYLYIKPTINISDNQWQIIIFLFIFNYIFTLINSPLKSPYYHFIGVILAPLAEEFMFRGWLLHAFGGPINTRIIIVSIIFGLYHLKNIQILTFVSVIYQLFYAIVIGMPLAWLAIKTNSLFLPIVLHSVNNTIAETITMKYFPWVIRFKK